MQVSLLLGNDVGSGARGGRVALCGEVSAEAVGGTQSSTGIFFLSFTCQISILLSLFVFILVLGREPATLVGSCRLGGPTATAGLLGQPSVFGYAP